MSRRLRLGPVSVYVAPRPLRAAVTFGSAGCSGGPECVYFPDCIRYDHHTPGAPEGDDQ